MPWCTRDANAGIGGCPLKECGKRRCSCTMWMPMDRMRNGSLTRDRFYGTDLEPKSEEPAYNAVAFAVSHGQNLMQRFRWKRDQQPRLADERKAIGQPSWIIDEAIERE